LITVFEWISGKQGLID